ncbi:MAG: 50S rRNA methyltransferase [Caldilinea sp. CFX5]|nr:50S rRNA methyltransferase [Caldilinea sp. CFX5]
MSTTLAPTLILTAEADFLDLALAELHKALPAAQTTPLADGVLLVSSNESFFDLAEAWRLASPIFVRHICPVQEIVSLRNKLNTDLAILRQHVTDAILPLVDPDLPFSVQTRVLADLPYKPFDLNNLLAEVISSSGAPLDVRNPQQILSVVCATSDNPTLELPDTQHATRNTQHVAYLGLSLAINNLSNWAGGVRRFAREEEQVSRSEFKLLEALEIFKIQLPARGVALDLGASPGGWTRVLRQKDQYVTAVDPGELDPRVAKDRGVRHKRMTAEQYLADEPDQFDLIVNDMRMDARDSARMMVAYAKQLYRHGLVIMTLKLPEQNRQPIIDHAFKLLQQAYTIAGARQLFHNRSEITVYLRLKGPR